MSHNTGYVYSCVLLANGLRQTASYGGGVPLPVVGETLYETLYETLLAGVLTGPGRRSSERTRNCACARALARTAAPTLGSVAGAAGTLRIYGPRVSRSATSDWMLRTTASISRGSVVHGIRAIDWDVQAIVALTARSRLWLTLVEVGIPRALVRLRAAVASERPEGECRRKLSARPLLGGDAGIWVESVGGPIGHSSGDSGNAVLRNSLLCVLHCAGGVMADESAGMLDRILQVAGVCQLRFQSQNCGGKISNRRRVIHSPCRWGAGPISG